jgi:hypothetical protein
MTPGPTHILLCPHCEARHLLPTLNSGNTFGATFWTDGHRDAPMLPQQPPLTRCHGCDHFFWVRDARKEGELSPWARAEERKAAEGAQKVRWLRESEYPEALAAGLANTPERERTARTLAWWAANDARRNHTSPAPRAQEDAARFHDNLERLLALLDTKDGPSDRLMRAEVLRELGRFEEALALLGEELPRNYEHARDVIRAACEARDANVRRL